MHAKMFLMTNLLTLERNILPAHANREPNYCPWRRYEINGSREPLLLKARNNMVYNIKFKVEH